MAGNCEDCGKPITDSHVAFTEQWEPGRAEVCYPHVNFGGEQLCAERTVERLRAQLSQAQAEIAALRACVEAAAAVRAKDAEFMRTLIPEADALGWSDFDAARAKLKAEGLGALANTGTCNGCGRRGALGQQCRCVTAGGNGLIVAAVCSCSQEPPFLHDETCPVLVAHRAARAKLKETECKT